MRATLLLLCSSCAGFAPPPEKQVQEPVHLAIDGAETRFDDVQVLSVDDANERFQITMVVKWSAATADPHRIELAHGDQRLATTTWGRSGDEVWLVFPATLAQARSFATALGVPAREREPWRGQLTAKLEAAAEVGAGAPSRPLRFTMTNTGPVALWFLDGGRGRNQLGRDNRFTFDVEHDGARLATKHVEDFGGLGSYRRLGPGESWAFAVDLAHWCALDAAGKYTVHATYEAELMPGDFEPGRAMPAGAHAHLRREGHVKADLVLDLR